MAKYYYKKKRSFKKLIRIAGVPIVIAGLILLVYIFFPLISWQIYFAPVLASQHVEIPIPKTTIVSNASLENLLLSATSQLSIDYSNANNWYPAFKGGGGQTVPSYTISIPKINISNAVISTVDTDLTKHMIQYNSDTLPPLKGNSVIFGHSTLPQLYNPADYKTILANAYKLDVGDDIYVQMNEVGYKYKIQNIKVVEPEDTSVLAQDLTGSYITIITCTPPGTIWKRLVIKAKLTEY